MIKRVKLKIGTAKKGMTLVEAVVAVGIFSAVITLAVGGFMLIGNLQRKNWIMRETQQNGRVALEIIAKEARNATNARVSGGALYLNVKRGSNIRYQKYMLERNEVVRLESINQADLDRRGSRNVSRTVLIPTENIMTSNLTFEIYGKLLRVGYEVSNPVGVIFPYDQDTTRLDTTTILEGLNNGERY